METSIYDWFINNDATPFEVSQKFGLPIEEVYIILKAENNASH